MMDRRGLGPDGEARQAERPIHDLLRLAYEQIRSLRNELAERDVAASEPIAIVGMGCRFPGGARDAASLWRVLRDGVDTVGTVPRERFDADALYDPDPDAAGKILSRCGAFLDDVDCFDSELFGISPLEAANMDPQQRVLLEVAWEALEDAGYDPLGLSGSRTGVYVGMMYQDHYARQLREMGREEIGAYLGTGATFSAAAGRVSYVLGLQGPSIVVDTACSSSLVSVHLACQALRNNECEVALAGGVNVMLVAEPTINLSRARMISPSGRCRTFDATADGYTRGEGCGVIVLKRLSAAEADGDRILGLVRGSAVNQDGRSNGFTAPSGAAQRAVFRDALAAAGVVAADVGYVECHGTGTPLGDPIEVGSIGDVYGERPAERPLALGAAKTNFGHLESAAGICGLIKALLVLQHGEIPPSLHLRELNPKIRLNGRPIVIPTASTPWFGNGPRLAAVNAFGFVGTNAQVILEAAPADAARAQPIPHSVDVVSSVAAGNDAARDGAPLDATSREQHWVLPLSATGPDVLDALCGRYADRLAQAGTDELADICFTASTGRAHLRERIAIVATSAADMAEQLRAAASGRSTGIARGRAPREAVRPVLLFTGQGSQYAGAGRRLYATQPRFRDALDHCCELLRDQTGIVLTDLLFAEPGSPHGALLDQTQYTQPALVALQLALLELWRHWGIEPAAVLGHSVGEISAAAAAGVLTPEDALRLAAIRGRLMQELPAGGGMAVVFAPANWACEAVAAFPETLAVAGFNAPCENVISGALDDLRVVIDQARAAGIEVKRLAVSHAFHSPLMRPMVARLRSALAGVQMQAPVVPLVSNLTGGFVAPEHIAHPDYWCEHVLAPVRFEDSVRTLAAAGFSHALELGPQPILAGLAMQIVPEWTACPTLRRGRDDDETACSALARLHVDGVAIDWRAVHAGAVRHRTAAPHYPFRRERHWLYPEEDRRPAELAAPRRVGSELLLGERVDVVGAPAGTQTWEVDAEPARRRHLGEHALLGRAIWPVSAQIELALEAARTGFDVDCCEVEDIELVRTLYAEDPAAQRIQVQLEHRPGGMAALSIHARRADDGTTGWQLHTRARVRLPRPATALRSATNASDATTAPIARGAQAALEFSMMFFAAIESDAPADRYALILEAARCGDAAGFGAVWVPERHFTPMGSLYPNPSVLHAALARETSRIHLRAGSVVLPLHHPIRIAEEWAMVDNLSGGRIGVSVAPGWNPADFLLASGNYEDRYRDLYDGVERLRALWRGEPVTAGGPNGDTQVRVYPTPLQKELPLWITAARNPESFRQAGALGTNLLTHLLDQDVDALAEKIAIYRAARAEHGHDPEAGRVTVMCHTFIADDLQTVRRVARKPFCDYLKASKPLLRGLAESRGQDFDIDALSDADMEAFVAFLYERFEGTRALFGTPDSCLDMSLRLRAAGVDEIACLLDFGLGDTDILAHLPQLAALRDLHEQACAGSGPVAGRDANELSVELAVARQSCPTELSVADFYSGLAARGVELQGSLRVLRALSVGDGRALGRLPGRARADRSREVGAAFIDGCLQTALAALLHHVGASDPDGIFVPTRVGGVQLHRPVSDWPEDDVHAFAQIADASRGSLSGSVVACDADGQPLLSIRDLVVERLKTEAVDDELADWGYDIRWRVSPATASSAKQSADNWIVLADERGVADAWLKAAAGKPFAIRRFKDQAELPAAEQFAWLDALDLTTCPGILCLWPLDSPSIADMDSAALLAAQARGVGTVIALVQAVTRRAGCPTRIWIGTSDAQAVSEDDAVAGCVHASLWGMAAAVAREHPRLWGGIADIDPKAAPADAASGIAALLRGAPGEDQIALRGGVQYVRRLVRAPLKPAAEPLSISGEGTYLIAGGLGGLGLTVARWLVERGARHLLLLARSVRDADDPDIAELASQGVTVDYRSVDIGDAAALSRILDDWKASDRPAIRGAVHAAGVFHDQPLEAVTPADLETGLRAKVVGAHALDRALGNGPLDFFLLFSSFSSLTPPAGQSVYASACAFLDGLAERRCASGQMALSIAWGAWSDVGFAATAYGQQAHARLAQAGMSRMTPDQGIAVLARLLGHPSAARVAVLPGDLTTLAEHDGLLAGLPILREVLGEKAGRAVQQSAAATAFLATLKSHDLEAQRELLLNALCGIVGDILKQRRERVEVSRRLTDLGLDSLVAMQFKNRIGRELGLDVSLIDLLRGASIASLAETLLIGFRVDAVRARQAPADLEPGREKVRDEFTL